MFTRQKLKSFITILFLYFTLIPTGISSVFDSSLDSLFSSSDNEFLQVDQAFQFNFSENKQSVDVTIEVAKGYYLYKDKIKVVSNSAQVVMPPLPDGELHYDEYFGEQQVYYQTISFPVNILASQKNDEIFIHYQGCAVKGLCYQPMKKVISLSEHVATSGLSADSASIFAAITPSEPSSNNSNAIKKQNNNVSEQYQLANLLSGDASLLWVLAVFFAGGILLAFTPCVFPMYPILAGIIVGQKSQLNTRQAFTLSMAYVQGMALTYTALGIVVALAGAKFQAMFQHPAVLVTLSVLFFVLALSMFGVFNLSLPSSWQNKLNQISNKQQGGSVLGVFLMGAISGLVASPCTTAPLTGALLYIAQSGDIVMGASALYALSLGMGLPLLVLGSSGGKLLPKAGAWMDVIKNVFGFLLLAVPIFLLERFIPAVVGNLLWAALILVSASYFYVVNQQSKKTGFWFGARSLLIFILLFSGALIGWQTLNSSVTVNHSQNNEVHFTKIANIAELNDAVLAANRDGKTVMVDLYADWCIACKEFEQFTFPDPRVQAALVNSVLLQVDLTDGSAKDNIAFMEQFDVLGLPSILFFDLSGNELTEQRVTGFLNAEKFSSHIKRIF